MDPNAGENSPVGVRLASGEVILTVAILERPDLVATVELSEDLGVWDTGPVLELPTTEVRLTSGNEASFIRIRFELTPDL